jgi:hypothetical protein
MYDPYDYYITDKDMKMHLKKVLKKIQHIKGILS